MNYIYALITFMLLYPNFTLATGVLVSGPTGRTVNGWYVENPLVSVNGTSSCSVGPWVSNLNGWSYSGGELPPQAREGVHNVKLITYDSTESRIDLWNDGEKVHFWGCNNGNYLNPIILWEGDIKWDVTKPQVSITSPSHNSNTDIDSVSIEGSVTDNASGVQQVIVNGNRASINDNTFKVSIPLSLGLNTIAAVAIDNAGHEQKSEIIVNRLQGNAVARVGLPAPKLSKVVPDIKQNSRAQLGEEIKQDTATNSTDDLVVDEPKPEDDTLVFGLTKRNTFNLTLLLTFIIGLLLLDKYKIIELRLFPGFRKHLKNKEGDKEGK